MIFKLFSKTSLSDNKLANNQLYTPIFNS